MTEHPEHPEHQGDPADGAADHAWSDRYIDHLVARLRAEVDNTPNTHI